MIHDRSDAVRTAVEGIIGAADVVDLAVIPSQLQQYLEFVRGCDQGCWRRHLGGKVRGDGGGDWQEGAEGGR